MSVPSTPTTGAEPAPTMGFEPAPTMGARPPRPGDQLPLFTLPDFAGRAVRIWDFKQRQPVVLAFLHGPGCAACHEYLAALAARHDDLAAARAAVLVVVSGAMGAAAGAPDGLARWGDALAPAHILPLVDADGAVAARYLPAARNSSRHDVALYVADRYGACGLAAVAPEAGELPGPEAILAELAHADEGTCACLEPAWPDEADLG